MEKFLEYLKVVKKRNERTIRQYRSILKEFRNFEPITFLSWKKYLAHISRNKPRTQRNKIIVVRQYLNWCADNGFLSIKKRFWNDAEPPRERNLPKVLELGEVKKIIRSCDNPYYKALFTLMVNTGMRISEVLALSLEDIAFNGTFAKIRIRGKGNKERVISIERSIVEEAIKSGVFSRHVTPRAVQKALKKYAKRAGIEKRVTPHMLRHTFAISLIERGIPVNKVQRLLGHSNLNTTGIYLQMAGDSIEIPRLI